VAFGVGLGLGSNRIVQFCSGCGLVLGLGFGVKGGKYAVAFGVGSGFVLGLVTMQRLSELVRVVAFGVRSCNYTVAFRVGLG